MLPDVTGRAGELGPTLLPDVTGRAGEFGPTVLPDVPGRAGDWCGCCTFGDSSKINSNIECPSDHTCK